MLRPTELPGRQPTLPKRGCSDELIMAVTGHTTARMVGLYAGKARQRRRAQEAQEKRK